MLTGNTDLTVDLWQIIAHHGYANQKAKAIEEMSELQQALARDLEGRRDRDNLSEEMADVYIMLGQLELIYNNHDDIVANVRMKLARTLEQVEAERTGVSAP